MVIVIDQDKRTGRPQRETDDRPRTEDYCPSGNRPIWGNQNPNEKPIKCRSSSNNKNEQNPPGPLMRDAAAGCPVPPVTLSQSESARVLEFTEAKTKEKRTSRRTGHLPAWEMQYQLAQKHGVSTCAGRKAARAALKALGVVSLPVKGKKYKLQEALDQILKFPYNSPERGAVTSLLCEGGYTPIKKSQLYKYITRAEKQKNQMAAQTTTKSDTSSLGLGYEGDYTRWQIKNAVKWKGSILLSVIPACDALQPTYGPLQTIDICSIIGNSDFAAKAYNPSTYSYTRNWQDMCKKEGLRPVQIDLDKMFDNKHCTRVKSEKGVSRVYGGRITKLYFDPKMHKPPQDEGELDASDNIVFGHLKNHIIDAAKSCGSPVICNGGTFFEKRFKCQRWHRRSGYGKERPPRTYNMHSCTFNFTVRWDTKGYYIPINNKSGKKEYNNGCGWHCCEKTG